MTDSIEIEYPKNFDLDNADRPPSITAPGDIGSDDIRIGVDKTNSVIVYNRKFQFGGAGTVLFKAAVYNDLKTLFDEFHNADAHTITLKQK